MTNLSTAEQIKASLGGQVRNMIIGGESVAAQCGETIDVRDPATGDVIAKIPAGKKEDVDRAVEAASQAFTSKAWRGLPPHKRGQLIWKLADLIEANLDELAMLETLDNGKPFAMSRAVDVKGAANAFRYYAGMTDKISGKTEDIPGFHAYTRKEPIGVVGQIVPWNFPIAMAAWKLAPALAAGCTLVLKPAELTPLTAIRLGELALEAGIPAGVVNIVTGYGQEAGQAIVEHPDIRKVAFTGSTAVGRHIAATAAKTNLKKVTLELGGKSPSIVFADADLKKTIPGVANSIFFNCGQVCVAGSRLFVEESIRDQVIEGVVEYAKQLKVLPGYDPDSQMGPLVSEQQLERVAQYLEVGKKEGAEVAVGGGRVGDKGYFLEPTVLINTRNDMTIMQEEIFGPVLCTSSFNDIEEVIAQANDTEYGLAASVWTKDISKAHKMSAAIEAGSVCVNCAGIQHMTMPFGGYKASGWGRENGEEGLEHYTETKSVLVKL